jgi:beta-glucosidase
MAEHMGLDEPRHGEGPTSSCDKNYTSCLTYGGHLDTTIPHDALGIYYNTAIIFLGAMSREGFDRKTLGFGEEVENMVKRFGKYNREKGKRTIVVMSVPGASTTNFRDDVDAILVHFYPGEMAAQSAIATILGKSVPSGKLPMTFPLGEND